jgi:hypothetical protein
MDVDNPILRVTIESKEPIDMTDKVLVIQQKPYSFREHELIEKEEPIDVVADKIKKCRGRPRIHPVKVVEPNAPKKSVGRPRTLDEYYVDGKLDKIAYYKAKKADIVARNSQKVDCKLCGIQVRRDYMNIHLKTKLCFKRSSEKLKN